jgi:cohesin complex subunit SA-1/2
MESSDNNATPSPSATDSRRRSGRVVRAPRKFSPDNAASKRKRGLENDDDEDAENDAPEDAEDEELSDGGADESEDEAAPRVKKTKAKAKKPAAKKPRVNGDTPAAVSGSLAPAVRLPNRPRKTVRVAIARRDGDGLYGKTRTLHS